MKTNSEALNQVIEVLKTNFEKSNEKSIVNTNELLNLIELLGQIYDTIEGSLTKKVFLESRSDLLNSLIFCFQGYYRHAYICLRSSIELLLSFLYYYDNQYDFILWTHDCIDMTWLQLTNTDNGVFNDKFLSIVNGNEVHSDKILKKIKEIYHNTSQYVHGKYEYMQHSLSNTITYDDALLKNYFGSAKEVIEIELVMLYIRFNKEIKEKIDANDINEFDHLAKKYEVI